MPRLFDKCVVGFIFTILGLAVVGLDVIVILWWADHMGSILAWMAMVLLSVITGGLIDAVFRLGKKMVDRA